MKKTYFIIEVLGVEPFVRGPFETEDERDDAAKRTRETQEEDDLIFWADVDETGRLMVGPYNANFFWQESTDGDH